MLRELTPELLRKLLDYDPASGHLHWKERSVEMFPRGTYPPERSCSAWNSRYSGSRALTAVSRGYCHGILMGHKLRAHRVIWAIVHGGWPEGQIDHINGDRADNRIENLREVDAIMNARNQSRRFDSTSGCTGVHWNKRDEKWQAHIGVQGRKLNLGYYDTKAEAVSARKAAEAKHGFHPNHDRLRALAGKEGE